MLLCILKLFACLLICKALISVFLNYSDYIPPDFESDFLQGRRPFFFGYYQWAFYAHIFSGPCSLISGLILVSENLRRKSPRWHRWLGRIHVFNVLLLVTPSGMWMAFYAESGRVAGIGFGTLAFSTGLCAALGWITGAQRNFSDHRRWMQRCFALLCSAVVLRIIAGAATVGNFTADWIYPFSAWFSWLAPLCILETINYLKCRATHRNKEME